MAIHLLIFCVLSLCVAADSAPWAQCCVGDETILRCTEELSRYRDCSTVYLPGLQFERVFLSEKTIQLKFSQGTRINLLVVSSERQFFTICDERISIMKFSTKEKRCNVKYTSSSQTSSIDHRLAATEFYKPTIILNETDLSSTSISEIYLASTEIPTYEHTSTTDSEFTTTDVQPFNFSGILDSTSSTIPPSLDTNNPPTSDTTNLLASETTASALPTVTTSYSPDNMTIIIVVPLSMATFASIVIAICRCLWKRRNTLRAASVETVGPVHPEQPRPIRPELPRPIRHGRAEQPRSIRPEQTRPIRPEQLRHVRAEQPRSIRPEQSASPIHPDRSPIASTSSFQSARSSGSTNSASSDDTYWLRRTSRMNYKE